MILAIDPGNKQSAFVLVENDLSRVIEKGKLLNEDLLRKIEDLYSEKSYRINHVAIEMFASFGMPVGYEVFDTCVFIGRLYEVLTQIENEPTLIYRKDEKMNLCQTTRAKDSNIIQALKDRFGDKGTKKNPGYFYGFKADIWQAMAVAVTYHDLYMKEGE